MTENLDPKITAEAWAKITIEKWQQAIKRRKIGRSGAAFNSFAQFVAVQSNGDVQRIELVFMYYLKFVDMGVGKGTKIGDVAENTTSRRLEGGRAGNRRRAKKWYGKVLYSEVNRLAEIMASKYATKAVQAYMVNEELKHQIKL